MGFIIKGNINLMRQTCLRCPINNKSNDKINYCLPYKCLNMENIYHITIGVLSNYKFQNSLLRFPFFFCLVEEMKNKFIMHVKSARHDKIRNLSSFRAFCCFPKLDDIKINKLNFLRVFHRLSLLVYRLPSEREISVLLI